MPVEAQIEELRAELKATVNKQESRQIERELRALTKQFVAREGKN